MGPSFQDYLRFARFWILPRPVPDDEGYDYRQERSPDDDDEQRYQPPWCPAFIWLRGNGCRRHRRCLRS